MFCSINLTSYKFFYLGLIIGYTINLADILDLIIKIIDNESCDIKSIMQIYHK